MPLNLLNCVDPSWAVQVATTDQKATAKKATAKKTTAKKATAKKPAEDGQP